jgi:hypothetical protein
MIIVTHTFCPKRQRRKQAHAFATLLVAAPILLVSVAFAQNTLDAQKQALDLITSTADRICNVVSAKGEAQSSEVQGNIKAQLSGLASKLADAGVSGSGQITSAQYQNVLRQDLASTLRDNAACKLKVFDTMHKTLFGDDTRRATAPLQPSSVHRLPPAEKVRSPEHISLDGGLWTLSLYQCSNSHENILCYFVLKKNGFGVIEYKAADLAQTMMAQPRLIDNFRTKHSMLRISFIDGRNQEKEAITLVPDDTVWLVLEFEGAAPDVTKAQIVFGNQLLQGPIK